MSRYSSFSSTSSESDEGIWTSNGSTYSTQPTAQSNNGADFTFSPQVSCRHGKVALKCGEITAISPELSTTAIKPDQYQMLTTHSTSTVRRTSPVVKNLSYAMSGEVRTLSYRPIQARPQQTSTGHRMDTSRQNTCNSMGHNGLPKTRFLHACNPTKGSRPRIQWPRVRVVAVILVVVAF